MNSHVIPERPLPNQTLLSVVLPVFNEAQALPMLLDRLTQTLSTCGGDHEIIFVDDGSSDDSPQVLDRLAFGDGRVRVIHLSRNFGHQAAIQAGLAQARGDAIVLMDSDMQDTPEAIRQFVAQWRAGYDVVYAVRTRRKESPPKRLLFAAFHRMMSKVASTCIPPDAGNFGLIDRRVLREILAMGERDRYFPGLRGWVGFRQTGVEVERNARYDDHPRVSLAGLCRLAKTAIFSFSRFPLSIFYVIGGLAGVLFLGLSGYSLFCKLFTDLAIPGWTSHVLIGSFFGAINSLGICILGEYVVRIYDQVRGRPLYLVDRTVNFRTEMADDPQESQREDAPYIELLEQAVRLLDTGTIQEDFGLSGEDADELSKSVLFPLKED